jgi:GNAT superfamily N-acetyltransferase
LAEQTASPWTIERLGKKHDRSHFDCGQSALDNWLKLLAGQYEKRDLARTFVAVRPGETVVLGFYALATHRVTYEALPADQARGLPKIDVPVILLGRLAVDRSVRGLGLGSHLLMDALRRAEHIAQQSGVRAVEVEAIDEKARDWYLKFGFVALVDDPNHLFLPMRIVRQLGLPPL